MRMPAAVRDQLESAGVDVVATARMARVLHRNRARAASTGSGGGSGIDWATAEWTSPWLVSCPSAAGPSSAGMPSPTGRIADRPAVRVLDAEEVPATQVITERLRTCFLALAPDAAQDQKLIGHPEPKSLVIEGLGVVDRVWPEAGREIDELIRQVILVDVPGLRSCSLPASFGAVFVGRHTLPDLARAVELLLYEAGQHSLYLRTAFASYVTNGPEVIPHPLRPHRRSVSDSLHVLFGLVRVVDGLHRWVKAARPDQTLAGRLDRNRRKLAACADAVRSTAGWTEVGSRFFEDCQRVGRANRPRPGSW